MLQKGAKITENVLLYNFSSSINFFCVFVFTPLRYSDGPCMASVCFCRFIHCTIHASSLGTNKTARRKSLVYG